MSSTQTVVPPCPHVSVGRNQLVGSHLGLVYSLAVKAYRATNRAVELDDLVAFGTEGLLQAADRFDPAAGAAFGTYAYYRIRGSIYDGLRTMAPMPRSAYRKLQAARRSRDDTGADSTARGADLAVVFIMSLDLYRESGGAVEATEPSAEDKVSQAEIDLSLRKAMSRLPAREKKLIERHYYGGATIGDAGAELGISKSWASRLHARAIDLLRQQLPELACT